jgi:prepilin-type N-terminal cleavage/methylation domain-containing protein
MLRFRNGYTLIEIIIVVTIMGLLVGASIAGFNTLNQRQTVLSAGREVVSIMRTAQQRAAAGIKPEGTCDQLLGYSVRGTVNSAQYTLSNVCLNSGVPTTTLLRTYQMGTGVTFAQTFTVQFNVQTGGAGGDIGDIALRTTAHTYTLNVNASGDISEKQLQ